jgi:putative membrane protein
MNRFAIACAAAVLPLCAFGADSPDAAFYMEAAQGGMAEVELGKLASEKGASEGVRNFGKQMVTDHGKANAKLKAAAMKNGVQLPAEPNAEQKAVKAKLQAMSGAAFDSAYVDSQVKDHDKTIALLEKEIGGGRDADAKAWASESLPVVKQHAVMIKTMAAGQHAAH